MLKKRIIPVQLLHNDRLVKSVQFSEFRDVGHPVKSSMIYSDQDADELILVNIKRDNRNVSLIIQTLTKISEVCFMPLTVGGGINSYEDAELLFRNGADKVAINSVLYRSPEIIKKIADKYGKQAIVSSIDVRRIHNSYVLYSNCGRTKEDVSLEKHIKTLIEFGTGELFIQSIDYDGKMQGYDYELLRIVLELSPMPVIIGGGAGDFEHLARAFDNKNLSAVACGSLFNFGDNNPIRAKAFLSNKGIPFKILR